MSQQNNKNILLNTIITGWFGGLFLLIFSYFLYWFNFIEVNPKLYLIRSWSQAAWTNKWMGELLSILLTFILSMIAAYIYFILFKRILSISFSALYGMILWLIPAYLISLMSPDIPNLHSLNSLTIFSSACLFILYGTFIGYSISFDYSQKV